MTGNNDIKLFAGGGAANTLTPAAYKALTTLLANGFTSGTASSQQINTVFRQSTFMAAGLAQFIADQGIDVNDDGNVTNLEANLELALQMFINTTFASLPLIRKAVSLNIATTNNGMYTLATQSITFPAASVGGQFRIKGHGIVGGVIYAATVPDPYLEQNYILSLSDGTTTINGASWLGYGQSNGVAMGFESTFYFPTAYAQSTAKTFTLALQTLGGSTHAGQLRVQNAELDLQVETA